MCILRCPLESHEARRNRMNYYYMDPANKVAGPVPKETLIELLKAKEIFSFIITCGQTMKSFLMR